MHRPEGCLPYADLQISGCGRHLESGRKAFPLAGVDYDGLSVGTWATKSVQEAFRSTAEDLVAVTFLSPCRSHRGRRGRSCTPSRRR